MVVLIFTFLAKRKVKLWRMGSLTTENVLPWCNIQGKHSRGSLTHRGEFDTSRGILHIQGSLDTQVWHTRVSQRMIIWSGDNRKCPYLMQHYGETQGSLDTQVGPWSGETAKKCSPIVLWGTQCFGADIINVISFAYSAHTVHCARNAQFAARLIFFATEI